MQNDFINLTLKKDTLSIKNNLRVYLDDEIYQQKVLKAPKMFSTVLHKLEK